MIALARARLRNSAWKANLTFEVGNAEKLNGIADQSVDLAICIGAFEHMLDKRAVLASIYRVLKIGGRFFCLTPNADYVWYRTIAPVFGFGTKHLSSDRRLTHEEFSMLLDQAWVSPQSLCSLDVHSQRRCARRRCATAHRA
jgi:ubiquinone/menaquinone biosynthesis C-methylase UbiE